MTVKNIISLIFLALVMFHCTSSKLESDLIATNSGLRYEIIKPGTGPIAKEGDEVLIEESTTYLGGTLIFSTDRTGGPLKVKIGGNQVIDGLDEGLRGMKQAEVRRLIVPPSLSKRSQYPSNVHPDSTLLYVVELVKILK